MCTEKKSPCIGSACHIWNIKYELIWRQNNRYDNNKNNLEKSIYCMFNISNHQKMLFIKIKWRIYSLFIGSHGFLLVSSNTSFQVNSTGETANLEKLYSYKHVVAGLVCTNNSLVLTSLNLERYGRQYCFLPLVCHICTTKLKRVRRGRSKDR